ncbi:(2Fe-2S)-binding protein [Alteromonas gilva]
MALLNKLLAQLPQDSQWSTLQSGGQCTLVATRKERLVLTIMLSATPVALPVDWLESLYSSDSALTEAQMNGLLNQQPDDAYMLGKIVCSCFEVRENTIKHAIAEGTNSVNALGKKLQCGTNCGSCKTELASLIAACDQAEASAPQVVNIADTKPVTEEN